MSSSANLPAPQVRQALLSLVHDGVEPVTCVDGRVIQSWQRSLAAGLMPAGKHDAPENVATAGLQHLRAQHHELISHSEPVMEHLFEQVRRSHSMVILADTQGVLVHTMGELDFLNKADRVALRCGASWSEAQRGTNAIGTALAESQEIEIHGAEHYLDPNGFLTCAAAPILSPQGRVLGILDVSGDHRARHPHTLGLVSTAAQMIENSLILWTCRHQILVQVSTRFEGLGTIAQGLLAFSEDGWLVGVNRRALVLLGQSAGNLGTVHWRHIFDIDFTRFLSDARSGTPQALRGQRGTTLIAQVHNQSVWRHKTTVVIPDIDDPLAQLDSGDPQWRNAADRARRVMNKEIALVVAGESGVGKELFAQRVHESSARRAKPFVAVNCAALSESLIEAELFGYVPGAFTGASRNGSAGRVREAQGGTLFLDEIGDMPISVQTRLLRVLQERQVTPVGSGTPIRVDFSLICATHHNLKQAVEEGRFRADLYYRINGLTVTLPPLRERTDLNALCQRMLDTFAPTGGLTIDHDLMLAFRSYAWPGNLRQLSQVLRTAVALLDAHESVIRWEHLPEDIAVELRSLPSIEANRATSSNGDDALPSAPSTRSLYQLSIKAMQQAVEDARGNVSAAARQLGVSRQTLYRKLSLRGGSETP